MSSDQSEQTFDVINSVGWRDGKIVINNTKEFIIKKKPLLQEEVEEPLVVSLVETDNVIHLLDGMQPLECIEPNTVTSYLSDGSYIITYEDEAQLSQDKIESFELEENVTEEISSPLLEHVQHDVTEEISSPLLENVPHDETNNADVEIDSVQVVKSSTSKTIQRKKPILKKKLKAAEHLKLQYITAQEKGKAIETYRKGKYGCCYSDDEDSPSDTEWDNIPNGYSTMDNLLNDLMERELIDEEFKELILKGLSEMKIDLIEVLMDVTRKKHPYELLTFAYLLFFKKRKAYIFLQKVFTSQWPTKIQLRDWKKLINVHRKKLRNRQQSVIST